MKKLIIAFFLGMYERARYGDGFGRTYDDLNLDDAYGRGANVVDFCHALVSREYRIWRREFS